MSAEDADVLASKKKLSKLSCCPKRKKEWQIVKRLVVAILQEKIHQEEQQWKYIQEKHIKKPNTQCRKTEANNSPGIVFFFLAAVHKSLFYRCGVRDAGLRSLGMGEELLNKRVGFVIQRHRLRIC